jgi:molybdopterin molybdotransferase
MLRVEEALDQILRAASPLAAATVPLAIAAGCVLAEDITADIDLPPFDNSAVDGYAVRAADTAGAPVVLRETGDVAAGQSPSGAVLPGTACRIMTGAPMPPGADAVVMIEDTRVEAAPGDRPRVTVLEPASAEQHVRRAGEDLRAGEIVLRAGVRIRPAETAMLATMGRAQVRIVRPPRVAVFSTGDELVDIVAGEIPPPGKIRDSNQPTLAALVQDAGALVHSIGRLPDDLEATVEALRDAAHPNAGADVILTAGGVSMGDRDFVRPAVERLGALALWRVAIKPGKPLAFGSIGRTLFFGLPGNPISAMVTFELFARPALRRLGGGSGRDLSRRVVRATVAEAVPHTPGRREYVRAVTEWRADGFATQAAGKQGSGMLQSAVAANSLLIVPEESEGLAAGAVADVMLLD